MADYFTQATISPFLPATLFNDDEIDLLETAFGLTFENLQQTDKDGGFLYVYASTSFHEEGEDASGKHINLIKLLQAKLRQMDDAEYPSIVVQGCYTCGKMRMNEFGGFAYHITRKKIRYVSTASWLDKIMRKKANPNNETIAF